MTRGLLNPTYRSRTAYHAMLLGGMAALASAALVLGDIETRADIAARREEDLKTSLEQVIPARLHDNDLLDDRLLLERSGEVPLEVYRARRGGEVTAVAYQVIGNGYAGVITCVIGVDRDGRILGVRVISHAETPGLGDKIEVAKSRWIMSFDGRSLRDPETAGWAVRKDGGVFDQFSGATITPRAVVGAVKQGLILFTRHRDELLRHRPTAAMDSEPLHAGGTSPGAGR